MQLQGKVSLITGAASGIGRAIAALFAHEGATVVVVDIDQDKGPAVAQEIVERDGQAIFLYADVTRDDHCRRVVRRTITELGRLDVLVNNAGIIRRGSVLETSVEEWDRVMAINVRAVFLLCRHAIPRMVASGGGVVVNVASGWGLKGGAKAAAYCASKGAVVNLTRALAIDHGPQGIRVNCICPGDTDTPMLREEAGQMGEPEAHFLAAAADRPLRRIGRPEEIAQAALYLAGETSSFVTGAALVVDGGGLA